MPQRKNTIQDDEVAVQALKSLVAQKGSMPHTWKAIEALTGVSQSSCYEYVDGRNYPTVFRYNSLKKVFKLPDYQPGRRLPRQTTLFSEWDVQPLKAQQHPVTPTAQTRDIHIRLAGIYAAICELEKMLHVLKEEVNKYEQTNR